jgi:hypothetical protein
MRLKLRTVVSLVVALAPAVSAIGFLSVAVAPASAAASCPAPPHWRSAERWPMADHSMSSMARRQTDPVDASAVSW